MGMELSKYIRELRKDKGYTQKELAEFLKVGQTTVANYEQGTRIPDIEKLIRIADLFDISMDYLLGRNQKNMNFNNVEINEINGQKLDEIYLDSLLRGDRDYARNFILNLYEVGKSIEYIFFDVIEKALKRVGDLWETGKMDIWLEHFISESCIDIIKEVKIRAKNNKRGKQAKIMLLNANAEFHNIGVRMISEMLEIEGFEVMFLGSNVPVQSLIDGIELRKPEFIAISTTLEYNIDSSKNMIFTIKNYFGKKSPKILIGGAAFKNLKNPCDFTGADYYCREYKDIKALLK